MNATNNKVNDLRQGKVRHRRAVQQGGDCPRLEVRPRVTDQRKGPQRGRGRSTFGLSTIRISKVKF